MAYSQSGTATLKRVKAWAACPQNGTAVCCFALKGLYTCSTTPPNQPMHRITRVIRALFTTRPSDDFRSCFFTTIGVKVQTTSVVPLGMISRPNLSKNRHFRPVPPALGRLGSGICPKGMCSLITRVIRRSASRPISQSINQPMTNQPTNQRTNLSVRQSVDGSIDRSINQSINQSIENLTEQPTSQPTNQPTNGSTDQ